VKNTAILLIDCPDQKGIVAAVGDFLYRHNANILHADQHQDAERDLFLMRVEWDRKDFTLDPPEFTRKFAPLAERFGMRWRLELSSLPHRVAVFVSKYDPFHVMPIDTANKAESERKQLDLLHDHKIDLVVLARYMQVLSGDFVARYPRRVINVHHSFLPAFIGARPYHRAFERGVKLIGATSHYVTEDLDEGPIIEQEVVRVSHRDGLDDLLQKGRDLEKVVLSRAVRWHIDHRVLAYAHKTVVFD
jgi:formyltetrahydrofolate deformylase